MGLALRQFGSIHHIARQLATGSVNIVTPGFAHRGHQSRLLELMRKSLNCISRGAHQT
jgi:hypothetical protein